MDVPDEMNDYDDSPWTSEELLALAWEIGKHAGWEEMDEYDSFPDKCEQETTPVPPSDKRE